MINGFCSKFKFSGSALECIGFVCSLVCSIELGVVSVVLLPGISLLGFLFFLFLVSSGK